MADLSKLFVFVSNANVADFKTNHIGKGDTDAFYKKVAFLSGTGEIATRGEIFATSSATDLATIKTALAGYLTDSESTNVAAAIKAVNDLVGTASDDKSKSTAFGKAAAAKDAADTADGKAQEALDAIGVKEVKEGDTVTTAATGLYKYVDDAAAAAVSKIVAGADASYDTLKEIADWIKSDTTGAAKMASDIKDLQDAGATKVEASTTNGNIKINGTETTVYTHPTGTETTAAAVKVGSDAAGHVVLGNALAVADIDGLSTALAGKQDTIAANTYDAYGAAAGVKTELVGSADDDTADSLTLNGLKKRVDAVSNHTKTTVTKGTAEGTISVDGGADIAIYTHPTATAQTAGAFKIGSDASGHVIVGDALTAGDIAATAIAEDATNKTAAIAGTDVATQMTNVSKELYKIETFDVWQEYTTA